MNSNRINAQMNFIVEMDKLKHVVRKTYLNDLSRRENAAEHSWHTALGAMILKEYAPQSVDINKVLSMLLIHDVVEILAGDTFCYDGENLENETKAAKKLFQLLPEDQKSYFTQLWQEFSLNETECAGFSHCLNMLLPLLHNYQTKGVLWKEKNITASMVIGRNKFIKTVSPELWSYVKSIIDKAITKGYLHYDVKDKVHNTGAAENGK